MSNLWVCGLVAAVGWLTVRTAEPKEEARPTPLIAVGGSWAERQVPKPAAMPLATEASNVTKEQTAVELMPAVEPVVAETPRRPSDGQSPELTLPTLESLPVEPVTRVPDPNDPPPLPPKILRAEPAAPLEDSGPAVAAEPASPPMPKNPEEGHSETKLPAEPAALKPTEWRAVGKAVEKPVSGAQESIAPTTQPVAPAPAKEEAQDLTHPTKQNIEPPPSTVFADEPDVRPRPSSKPIPVWERASLPTGTAADKTKSDPIAATPAPRLVPKAMDNSAVSLGTPHVVSSAETSDPAPCRLYGSGEYLTWFTRGGRVPALVTTGPVSSNGILGQPGTVVLFGGPGTRLNDDVRQGARFTLGYWLDPCQELAVEGSFFFLGDSTTRFRANSDAFPILARPFFRINTGSEFSEIATRPDLANGAIHIESPTRLWGAELNARYNLCSDCNYRIDGLLGVRYLDLKDGLHITEDLMATPTLPTFANDHIVVSDRFDTHNRFFGSQAGLDTEWRRGRFFVDFRGKVALGDNHETLDIRGSQTITAPQGTVQKFRGGLLALPSNIGHFTRDRFAVVPEVGLTVGYHVTEQLRVSVGYNFLWWSNVLRAGDQIDRVIDETQIPNFGATHAPAGQNRPAVLFKETDYWAQGVMFSVEYRY